jgi:hypothetical protein
MLKIMVLCETGTRALLGAVFGPTPEKETGYAEQLLPLLDDSMLLLNDRGFDSDDFLAKAAATGAQLLVRLKGTRTPARWALLPDGSFLTRINGTRLRTTDAHITVTTAKGLRLEGHYRLATTLTDQRRHPAAELVELYHERWEIESAFYRAQMAARGFALGVELLPRLASRGLLRSDATRWMAEYSRLASDAAACALAAGLPDQAVEVLEMGRGVLLAQALESRTDLTELRERAPDLADRFDYVCALLDGSTANGTDLITDTEDDPDFRRKLAQELDGLLARIRTLPGLERFLLPPHAAQLVAEADRGPIVMVNVSGYRCDALVLTTDGIQVCELPDVDYDDVHDRLSGMRISWDGVVAPVTHVSRPNVSWLRTRCPGSGMTWWNRSWTGSD